MREKLLTITKRDLDIQSFRPGGAGGQHRDKTSNAVRVVHRESGAVGESSESRSWHENRRIAFGRMARSQKFMSWVNAKFPGHEVREQPTRRYTYRAPHIDMEHRTMQER